MPLEQDILSIGFDWQRTQADADKVLASINRLYEGAQKVSATFASIDVSGGLAASKKGAEDVAKAVNTANTSYATYGKTLAETTKQQILDSKAKQEAEKAAQQELKTLKLKEDQLKRTAKAQKEAADVPFTHNLNGDGTVIEPAVGKTSGSIVSDVEKMQVQGILSAKEYAEAQKGVSAAFVESSKSNKDYTVTEKEKLLAIAQDKLIAQQQAAAIKNQVREEVSIKGSIEQRRAALIRLNSVYDNLSPQERNSAAGQRLQKITKGLTDQLKELEGASGRAQRNVGNYPTNSFNGLKAQLKDVTEQYTKLTAQEAKSAEGKALKAKMDELGKSIKNFGETSSVSFSKAYSGIRILANILPGLGISGIFLLAGQAIASTVEWIKEATGKVVDFAERMKILSQVNLKAIDSFGEQRSHIEGLTAVLKDGNITLDDKKRALKDLIALDPKFLEGLTLANVNTKEGQKILNDYIDLLRKKAELEAAGAVNADVSKEVYKLEVIKELLRKRLVATKTNYDDLTEEELKYVSKFKTSTGRINFTASLLNLEVPKSDIQQMLVGVDEELKKAGKKVTASMDVFKTKFAAVDDKDVKLGIVEKLRKEIEDISKKIDTEPIESKIKGLVATRKKLEEQLENLIDKKKDPAPKHIKSISDAVAELNKELQAIQFDQKEGILSLKEADIKRVEKHKSTIEEIFKIGGAGAKPMALVLSARLSPIAQRVLQTQIHELAEKFRNADETLAPPIEVKLKVKDSAQAYEDAIKGQETLNATALSNELAANAEAYSKKLIAEGEYQRTKKEIQKKYTLKGLDFLITELEHEKEYAYKGVELTQEVADKKNAIDARLAKAKADRAELLTEQEKELSQKFKEIAEASYDLGTTLLDARYERELNHIQDLMDANDKYYAREIENINNSTLSAQDKAAQITVLEAEQAAKRTQLDKKQRDEQLKQAKFDRDAQALKILGETLYQAAKFGWITPLAIAIEALGAIQIATLYAKPLPHYKDGLKDNPVDHYGVYGEAGAELVNKPGQMPFIADRATVDFLPRGTTITPMGKDEVNAIMYRGMARQTAATVNASKGTDEGYLLQMEMLKELKKSNKKRTMFKPTIVINGGWENYKSTYYKS